MQEEIIRESKTTGALFRKIKGYLASLAFLVLCWHLLSLLLDTPAMPQPLSVFQGFFRLFISGMWLHFSVSLYRVAASIALGVALAVPFGLIFGQEKTLDRFAAPLIFLTYPIPKIVFLPVILILLGIGNVSKITLIALIVFFQILVTTRDASRSIPNQSILSVLSLGAGRWQIYRHVVYPACLPKVFTALRISVGTAIAVLFFAESFATTEGLGYFIMDAWAKLNYTEMFGGILGMAIMGAAVYEFLELLEGRVCAWTRI